MFYKHSALTLLALVLGCCALPVVAQQTPKQILIERARLLDAEGRHELAAENWRQVLLLEPRQPDSLAALAEYYRSIRNMSKAQYYQALLNSVRPDSPSLAGDKVAPTQRANNDGRLNQAANLAAAHRYSEALAIFHQVFGNTPPDNWAVAYYQTEAAVPAESANGIAGLRALTSKYPADPSYQLALAQILTYRPATRAEGMKLLSAFRGTAAQNEQARNAWRAAILWDPASAAALENSKLYLQRYPDDALRAQVRTASNKGAGEAATSPEEGEGYRALTSGEPKEAASHFTAMTKKSGLAARGELGLGYVSMKQKDFQAAISHFEIARAKGIHTAALEKALVEARYWEAMSSGNEALQAKDVAKAASEFAHARKVDSNRPEATEALAGSMLAARDPQHAAEILASDVKNNPDRPEAWIRWMNALLEESRFDRIISVQQNVPSRVRAQLVHRPDYLAILLCAELAQGNAVDSRMLRDRIAEAGAQGADADVEAARILFRNSYFDDASRLSLAALNRDVNSSEAWQILIQAEHMAGRDRNAMAMIGRMPHSINVAVMSNAGFLLALSSIYQSEGQLDDAKALLDQAQKLSNHDQSSLTPLEMQKASLAQAQGDSQRAYDIYQKITDNSPGELDAWIGMLSALHAGNHDADALAAMHDLPEDVKSRLRHDAAFLQIAGFIYSATGHSREALLCLRAVTDHYEQQHQTVPFGAGIELAWLQLNTGDQRQLAATLDRLGKLRSLSLAQTIQIQKVWSAWSMRRAEAAFVSGNAAQAMTILQTAVKAYPGDSQLRIQLAGMYVRIGHAAQGVKIFQAMDWNNATLDQFTSGINAAIATNSLSDARYWLYLGLEKYPGNTALLRAGAHVEERKGNLKAAEKYLNLAAASMNPGGTRAAQPDAPVRADSASPINSPALNNEAAEVSPATQLASLLATADSSSGSAMNESDSSSSPDGSTVETSPAVQEQSSPVRLQQESLPGNRRGVYYDNSQANLVRVGAGQAATKTGLMNDAWQESPNSTSGPGSLETVDTNRKAALNVRDSVADPLNDDDLGLTNDGRSREREHISGNNSNLSLQELLDSAREPQKETAPTNPSSDLETALLGQGTPNPAAFSSSLTGVTRDAAPPNPALVRSVQPKQDPTPSDELANLQARYSPLLLAGGIVSSHSGTEGFDHLQDYEGEMAASTVLGVGAARLSVITRPVMLQSGVPDSTSNYRFGSGSTLPADTQFASGNAASLQLATRDLQASIGTSPSGFLVRNVLGSVTFRPLSGPFTVSAYRASQKDSLLSYAGVKDPDTGQVWGGVVATGGSLQYAHGGAASGFYASIDGQKLTGVNVTENTRMMGNAGAYWLAYSNEYGDLKIGANLTAMHYALNQRYFTIGQGGYFSPDAFLLMNAPITWQGRPIHNTSYMIGGSLGAQSIQETAAMPGSLIAGTGVETTAGASYDLHLKVAHRMDPHWTLEGFLDANNARQYKETSTGFTVRYASHPQTGDATGPGFLNVMEPLPLQAP